MKRLYSAVLAIAFAALSVARAEEPAKFTYVPLPPGTTVTSKIVYLAGQAMHSQWRGVVSKQFVGTSAGMSFYQWYVSVYAIDGTVYKLKYRSPGSGGPFDKLERTSDASMWFPSQSGDIVGAAQLMGTGVEQLIVTTHQIGADCGSADITIFGYDPKAQKVVPRATLENGCELDAKIVRGVNGASDELALTGPYYDEHAAMCCPTKNKATATLSYANGKWTERPNYFKLYPNAFPHP